ncbi:MAG: hypothetical protein KDC27_18875, partial [Acidobacteria bacterium]|nr:hypothetical protein [Acidobacteriota bacterium]
VYANTPIGAAGDDDVTASRCLYGRDFALIAGLGANTIRTEARLSPADRVFRRTLESADLYWIAGFPVRENLPRVVDEIAAYADDWAPEPRLLAISIDGDGSQEFFALLAQAAARIHQEHPGLLVTTAATSVREIGAFDRSSQDGLQPDLDFWSLALPGRTELRPELQQARQRTSKPLLVASFGVDAYDDLAGAADLEQQALFAGLLAEEVDSLVAAGSPGLIGGLYGELSDQWHKGGSDPSVHGAGGELASGSPDGVWNPAWAGLLGLSATGAPGLDSLRQRPAYQELAEAWSGLAPAELTLDHGPSVAEDGFRNAASASPALAPGALFEVVGDALSARMLQSASPADLPFYLGSTSVCLGGEASPLYLAEPGLVRGVTPWEARAGTEQAVVFRAGAASLPTPVEIFDASPGILTSGVFQPGLPCPVNEANGVPPGAYLEVYGSGLGNGAAPQLDGVAPSAPVEVLQMPTAWLGPYQTPVLYAGLFPGTPGVYQTNVRISPDAGPGPVELRLAQGVSYSNIHRLRVLGPDDTPGVGLGPAEVAEVALQGGGPVATVYLPLEGYNGFCNLVRFEVSGLPAGVRASIPVGFPGQRIPLTLWAEQGAAKVDDAMITVRALTSLPARPSQTVRVSVLPGLGDVRLRVVSGGWLSGTPSASFSFEDRILLQTNGGGPGRGFNFLTIDPRTGVLGELRQFDTWGSEEAVTALESYLRGLTPGTLVLGAIADDATLEITPQTRALITEKLGAELIDFVEYQWSWAVIARVGAARPIAEGMRPNGTVVLDRIVSFPLADLDSALASAAVR